MQNNRKTERPIIAIIGAGINGVLTALELSKKGYAVNLLEARDKILMGATRNNAYRLHLGPHYPLDQGGETALHCIKGSIDFINKFPDCVRYKSFANFILDGKDPKDGKYSFDSKSMIDHEKYMEYIQKNRKIFDEAVTQHPESPLFKLKGKAFEEVDPEKYKDDVNIERVKCVVESAEFQVNMPKLTKKLRELVENDQNITLYNNFEVNKASKVGNTFYVKFSNDSDEAVQSDAVINCSWNNAPKLDKIIVENTKKSEHKVNPEENFTTRLKYTFHIKIAKDTFKKDASLFFGLGPYGGITKYGEDKDGNILATMYCEKLNQENPGYLTPESWERELRDGLTKDLKIELEREARKTLSTLVPALADPAKVQICSIEPVPIICPGKVNSTIVSKDLSCRSNSNIREIVSGWFSAEMGKLTYSTIQAEKNAEAASLFITAKGNYRS